MAKGVSFVKGVSIFKGVSLEFAEVCLLLMDVRSSGTRIGTSVDPS